jgi:hypothetical protein
MTTQVTTYTVRYVFTATKLFEVGGDDEGVWFADRCSEFLFVSVGETLVSGFPFSTCPLFGITKNTNTSNTY